MGIRKVPRHRRIEAARLLSAVPAAAEKLQDGSVNLTTLTQVQSTIRREEKRSGRKISKEVKQDLIEKIQNKSSEQAERILVETFPMPNL
jgi:dynactin complex subunit